MHRRAPYSTTHYNDGTSSQLTLGAYTPLSGTDCFPVWVFSQENSLRLDSAIRFWILKINTNPQISTEESGIGILKQFHALRKPSKPQP